MTKKSKNQFHFTSETYTCKNGKFVHLVEEKPLNRWRCVYCGLLLVNPMKDDLKA